MTILVGKNSGLCGGVKYTIDKANEIITNNDKIYCLGEIVHNEEVIKELSKKGIITVDNIEDIPDNSKVIFRAHGVPLKTYHQAKNKNLEIFDLTCNKIKIIHKQISEIKNKFIIIIGKRNHPEVIGTFGFTENAYIIEDINDINPCYQEFIKSNEKEIYIISQTTYSNTKFDKIVNIIKTKFDANITINKSICNATEKRQQEVEELSKKVTNMIIVGGKNSSNTKELYNLAKKHCKNVQLYQTYKDIDNIFDKDSTIGIMAGASTPNHIVEEIVYYLRNR